MTLEKDNTKYHKKCITEDGRLDIIRCFEQIQNKRYNSSFFCISFLVWIKRWYWYHKIIVHYIERLRFCLWKFNWLIQWITIARMKQFNYICPILWNNITFSSDFDHNQRKQEISISKSNNSANEKKISAFNAYQLISSVCNFLGWYKVDYNIIMIEFLHNRYNYR